MAATPFRTERFLARRYLTGAQGRPEGRRFLRFVVYIAVGGVAIGVAALLLAFSIVRGFTREIQGKILGIGSHVQVESHRDAPLDGISGLVSRLKDRPDVTRADPSIVEFVLLRHSSTQIEGASVWGTGALPPYIRRSINEGSDSLGMDAKGERRIVLGARLARSLGVVPGDRVTAFSVRGQGSAPSRIRVKAFVVSGTFETYLAETDDIFAFVQLDEARDLLSYGPDQATRIDLTLDDPARADSVAAAIERDEGFPILARSIYEVQSSLFAWINLQQKVIPMVIAFIILVAAFNIIGTLLMLMVEKTREIGILQAMGATPRLLRRTFLLLGALIGSTGIAIGEALALGLALLQQRYGIIPLPADSYFMTTAPIQLSALDFVVVALVTVILCAGAAYVPARFAGRVQPIQAIHFR